MAQPQMAGAGVANRVGDDFLGAAQQHLRALGIVDLQALRQLELHIQGRHALDQHLQGVGQVDAAALRAFR